MADLSLLARADLDPSVARAILRDALSGADDGELFLEYEQSESAGFRRRQAEAVRRSTPPRASACAAVAGEAIGLSPMPRTSRRAGAEARRRHRQGGALRQLCRQDGRIAARHQPAALRRRQSDRRRGVRPQGGAAAGDRRLCARQGAQGPPGLDLDRRHPGRSSRSSRPAAGAPPTFARWSG